jgi:hypothetical protein
MVSDHKADFIRLAARRSTWQPPRAAAQRRTLFDLSPMTHCSIIGTCLTMAELRKIVVKIVGESARKLNDHEIHTAGVRYASIEGLPSKLMTKALDEKHATVVRKLASAEGEDFLRGYWANARREGMVEGPYWPLPHTHLPGSHFLMRSLAIYICCPISRGRPIGRIFRTSYSSPKRRNV